MDPDPVTDIKPLTNGHHGIHSIGNDEAHDASILSNHTQDLKNPLKDASNDTLADDLIATHVESVLKASPTQLTEVAPLTMQSNSESQTELSHSIGVSDTNTTAGSNLANPSTSAEFVPPNGEHDKASAMTDVHVEEPLQEVIMPSTSEPLTTDPHATSDNEEQPIEEAITTTSDNPVPAISDASDADKGAVIQSEAISSETVEDSPAQVDAGTTSISDASLDIAQPFLPDAATDVSPVLTDAITTQNTFLLENPTVDTAAEDAAAPDVAGESSGSDFAEIVADIPTAEDEDEQVETLATSLTSEHVEPTASVELSADSVGPVRESTPTTSSAAHLSEPSTVESLEPPMDDTPAEATLEPTMEIHDEETPAAPQEPTTYVEPSLAVEVPTSVANDVEDVVLLTDAADVAASSDTVEVNGHLNDNPTESEAPGPIIDAFGLVAQDTTIVESVTAHVEVYDADHISSAAITVPTAETESDQDAAPLSETTDHALEPETITPNEAAENVHASSSQAVEFSQSDLTTAEEASGLAPELVDEDDAALHVHPKEAVDLTITDADPVDRELLQYVESTEEPLDDADHGLLVENELGEDIRPSDSETDEATPNAEVHEVQQELTEEISVEELGGQMVEASDVPETVDNHPASGPDDNLQQGQLATIVDSDLPPDDVKPLEADTAPEVDDNETNAVDPVINEAFASTESSEDDAASAISEAQRTLETAPLVSSLVEEATLEESKSAAEATTHIETVEQDPLSVEEPVSQDPDVQQVHQGTSPVPEAIDTLPTSELDEEQLLGIPNSEILPEVAKPFEVDAVPVVIQEENTGSTVDPIIAEAEPEEDVAPSVVSEAEHAPEIVVVESLSVAEETQMEEVKFAEETMTHAEVHDAFMEDPPSPELQVQEVTSTMPEAIDNLPVLESDSNSQEQAVQEVEPDLQDETKVVEADAVTEMIEKKTIESSADISLADDQSEITIPPADEEHLPDEAQAPPEPVEQEALVVTDATESCEETVAAAEPPHAQYDTVLVETVSAQENTTGPGATETVVVASIEEDTPPSSEQPHVVDVEDHFRTDAKTVDEELPVHKDPEVPETQELVGVEASTDDVDSAILTGSPVKEETIHTENELSIEESIVKLSYTNSREDSVEVGATEGAVKEVSASFGDAPVPDISNEPISNQNPDIEIEGTSSTVERHVTEDTVEVPPAQDTLVAHEDEMPSAESNDIPSIQAQPASEVQPPAEEASLTAGSVDDVSVVPAKATGDHCTPETTTSASRGETIQAEDIATAVEENIVAPQQTPVEQNALEEATSAAQEPPTPEERVVTIPATQDLKSSDISNQESHVIGDTGGPITSETKTYSESVVDTIAVYDLLPPKDDTLKAAEAEIERPKSPWMPSFQVTTVGRGVSSSTEDEQLEFEESTAAPAASSNDIVLVETLVEEKVIASALEDRSLIEHIAPQLLVDNSLLDTTDEVARPWTPSYSVHSQGSPLHSPGVLEQDDQVLEVGVHELPEMKFADNEQISISNELSSLEPMTILHLDSAAKPFEPLAGTEITDLADVKAAPSNSGFEEPLDGSTINDTTQRLEASIEVDTSFLTEETRTEANQDATPDLKHSPQIPRLILDDFTEAAAPIEAYDSPSGNVHKESSTISWVPSYSVSRQGSPVHENTKLPEVESVDILELDHGHDLSLVDKPSDVLADPKASTEEATNVQVLNLQMTDKEIGNHSEPDTLDQATLVQGSTVEVVDDPVDPRGNDLVIVTDVEESRAQSQILSHTTSVDDSADRPKSPWTPSYSVTVQGAIEGETFTSSRHDVDSQDTGIEYVKISGIREPEKNLVQPEEGTANLTVSLVDFPDSAPQSTLFRVEAGSADLTSQEPAPSVDRPTEALRAEVPQLEPISEAAKLDEVSAEVSPKTRKRLESTASSRFFPGAWFSTASVVDEGRTSLEIARGEFTSSKPTSPNDDAPDSPVLEDASSTDDDEDDDAEPEQAKRRWCVVM